MASAPAMVTLEDVRKQLEVLGYSNVPDDLVREFLEDISQEHAKPLNSEAREHPSPSTPSTPVTQHTRYVRGGHVGPWVVDGDEDVPDAGLVVSPFDDPSRGYENFPPWPEPFPDEELKAAIVPPSPPFELHASPTRTFHLRHTPPGRVPKGGQMKTTTGAKKTKKKAGKPTTAPSSLATRRPATAPASAARRSPTTAPPAGDVRTPKHSRAVSSRVSAPAALTPSRGPRHVSGSGVIYAASQMSTTKERANQRGLGFRKSDPVAMYQQHAKAWAGNSFLSSGPCTPRRAAADRLPRSAGSPSQPLRTRRQQSARASLRQSSASFTSVPTEKRRDDVRWAVRVSRAPRALR
jgi:hypothetical protein